MARPKPVLLLILDGWGESGERDHNAIAQADCPNWRGLLADCPHTLVDTHGAAVGLPEGQMGNSEVGHMNIGAGRVVYQELTRIDRAIETGEFAENTALLQACDTAIEAGSTLHLLGLIGPGGVHSHQAHIEAMLKLAAKRGVASIAVHAFLDGRDTPPKSARASLRALAEACAQIPGARIASVSGRYYAMDRDGRWERIERAWRAIVRAKSEFHAASALEALENAYARDETDEFVKPVVIGEGAPIHDGDAAVFMNFRADRARQLSRALNDPGFSDFDRGKAPKLAAFVTLTQYDRELPVTAVAFPPASLENTLGQYLADQGMRQLRIAETEKYAHVTFFFSGGREEPFAGEERILVPSPKVATYDLQPEMSAPEVTERLVEAIRQQNYDFIVCNLANADMVGHTGKLDAAIKAVTAIDEALGRLRAAIEASGGEMLITADHGNIEQMLDADGEAHTQHTVGPVPLVYVGRAAKLQHGALKDIAPTVLALLDLPQPQQMQGHSLVRFSA